MQSKSLKFQDPEKIHAASARNHEFSDVIFEGPNFSEVSVALPPYVGAQRCPPNLEVTGPKSRFFKI